MYLPNKAAKYGLKVQILAYVKTDYMVNSEIYLGKQPISMIVIKSSHCLKSSHVVLRLVESVIGTNRNITCDNWYSSVKLADELSKKKLTFMGTVIKRKAFILAEFLSWLYF